MSFPVNTQSTLRPPEVHICAVHFMSTCSLYGAYRVNDIHAMHVVLSTIELLLLLSTIEQRKSWASCWYQEQDHRCRDSRQRDDQVFSCIWLRASLNSGQICNTQNSTMELEPQAGKYQSNDPAKSQICQIHLASMSTLQISKTIHLFSLLYF